ncbi:MAG: serine/threonine-protein kinase, partial [Candidatus Contendobacter sp.]|nr:serine/threonine-protein kinase [Candidatus Contendobacter sp.]
MSFKGSHSNPFPEGGQGNENPRQGTSVQIAGYQIDCQIGRGGMATVYRAMQQSLGRQVAIKILAQSPEEDDEFAQRFKKEGRILARLLHPNIITIHDVGISENNQLFLSIEYLPGGTLGDRIKQGLSFESAIQITKAIAKALGYAHERGIIHRDVKPSNILFRQDGTPVLTDFGVARILESKTIHTLSGLAVGSPGYMSPEQAMGENATIQSDLYSLGVVLYEMLAGQRLYEASNLIAITLKHLHDPIPYLPRQYAHLQPVLNKLLAKKNTDRYRNTNEFLQELDAVTNDSTITQSVDRDISHISVMEFTTGKIQALFRKKLRRPVFILMTGFIVIIISISIFYIFGSWQKSHKENQYQLRLQAEEFFSQAQIHFQEGLLETGLYYTQQGLLAMPDHQDLLALRDQIQIRMAEEDRKRQ